MRSVLPRTLDQVMARPRPWRLPSLVWALVPAALLLVVWIARRPPPQPTPAMKFEIDNAAPVARTDVHRARLQAFARASNADVYAAPVRELVDGSSAAPGELVRLAIEQTGYAYVTVVTVDARGHVVVRAPNDGGLSLRLSAGRAELPGSWLIENGELPLSVFALFSADAFEVDALRSAIEHDGLEGDHLRLPTQLGGRRVDIDAQRRLRIVARAP